MLRMLHPRMVAASQTSCCIPDWPLHPRMVAASRNGCCIPEWLLHPRMVVATPGDRCTPDRLLHPTTAAVSQNGGCRSWCGLPTTPWRMPAGVGQPCWQPTTCTCQRVLIGTPVLALCTWSILSGTTPLLPCKALKASVELHSIFQLVYPGKSAHIWLEHLRNGITYCLAIWKMSSGDELEQEVAASVALHGYSWLVEQIVIMLIWCNICRAL